MNDLPFIPVHTPQLDGNEKRYLQECIDSGWISSEGPFVTRFEEAVAARVGRRHGVAVSSGTAALDVAVAALGIGPGDEVILPTFTIISCAASIVRMGATPVLVDQDPTTWNMDMAQIRSRITPATKAIMAVHIYGLPIDMREIAAIAEENSLMIIEDAAQMHGQECWGKPCGGFGDVSIFSFYANKAVSSGEGGMVLTNDDSIAERSRRLRNLYFQPGKRFVHEDLGWNYRMTNMQAAVGLAQLERLDETVAAKRRIAAAYTQLLSGVSTLELPRTSTDFAESVYWVYGIVLTDKVKLDAEEAMSRLHRLGIGARPFFWPMHEQPVFKRMGLFGGEQHPHAERFARRGFYIPNSVSLRDSDLHRIAEAVRSVVA